MGATLEILLQDIRFGLRTLWQSKVWTAIIILSLGVGIGANTAIFSLVNGLLLRTLSVSKPETLVRLRWSGPADLSGIADKGLPDEEGHDLRTKFSRVIFDQLRTDDFFACDVQQVVVSTGGEAATADGLVASGNYYQVLEVRPALGRTFTPDDDRPEAPPVAVISHGYWKRSFQMDPNVVGRSIIVNDLPVTIVGVTPQDFLGVQGLADDGQDITFPLVLRDNFLTRDIGVNSEVVNTLLLRGLGDYNWHLQIMGRLKPGVTAAQVQASLNGIFQDAAKSSWAALLPALPPGMRAMPVFQNKSGVPHLLVESGSRGLFDTAPQAIRASQILTIVVALILVIVCANVANLMLSRATTRRREISVRLSMGATRTRLIRQLITESLILSTAGGILGLAVNQWGRALLLDLRAISADMGTLPPLDWRVFAFVFALTLFTALAFGLAPALRATQIDLNAALKENSRSMSIQRSALSKGLLIAQVAVALVLVVGAGLFLQTVRNLRNVAVGFNPQNVLTFHLSLRAIPLTSDFSARISSLSDRIVEKVGSIPGVLSIGGSNYPFWQSRFMNQRPIYIEGGSEPVVSNVIGITPGFFETMQVPLLSGRTMKTFDLVRPIKSVVINETAARRFFNGQDAVGRRIGVAQNPGLWEVVGVVGNASYGDVRNPPEALMYMPGRQTTFVARTEGDPMALASSIRDTVHEIDPAIPITEITTETELMEGRIQAERLFARFYTLFGVLAMLLAAIGLFGLMSYNVVRRTNEIGVRIALGAQREDVVGMVMRDGLSLVVIGIVIGIVGALLLSRLLASQLYGLAEHDVVSIAAAVGLLLAVSAAAAYLPARHASRVDPLSALRHD